MVEQMSLFSLDSCYGKTYQGHYPAHQETKGQISKPSSQSVLESKKRMPLMCLSLKAVGQMPEFSWEEDGALLGKYQTYNISDAPKDGKDWLFCATSMEWLPQKSCLSSILLEADPKYRLSVKACQGILNRASRRGKALPGILETALKQMIQQSNEDGYDSKEEYESDLLL